MTQAAKFDYAGERAYYARPVTAVREWRWLAGDMAHWVPGFPEVFRDKSVLDFGAGECLTTFVVAEMGHARRAVALELILHSMYAARQMDLPGLELVCGDGFFLPFANHSFEVVIGNGVLHHLPDEDAAIREIGRVLKPGGVYFGREPNFRNPLVRRRVLGGHHTPNEHVILPEKIRSVFGQQGMQTQIKHFWRRFPWLHHSWLAVSISITASKVA